MQQVCSQKDLASIAGQLIRWDQVYMYLGVTQAQAQAVRRNHSEDYEAQKIEIFNIWKRGKGKFQGTFRELSDVFLELGDQQMVDNIKKVADTAYKGLQSTFNSSYS